MQPYLQKKEEIWLSPMTKAPIQTEMSKGQSDYTNNATKKFNYTAVADRLRAVSWSNYSHPTGMVDLVYGPNLIIERSFKVHGKNFDDAFHKRHFKTMLSLERAVFSRYVIGVLPNIFIVSLCNFDLYCLSVRAFVIRLRQISSLFSHEILDHDICLHW